ncbi:MAG TPA: TROVE domain-containing protein [Euryarchaeota archaeon]|nr:TROVE domain-containing protein [Euryarchaeota archaeon]
MLKEVNPHSGSQVLLGHFITLLLTLGEKNPPEKVVKTNMPKFNEKAKKGARLYGHPNATPNLEGGLSFVLSPKNKLYTMAATSLVGEPKFYQTGEESLIDLTNAIHEVIKTDPEFVLKLAVYCRTDLHLRSVPLYLVNEVAYFGKFVDKEWSHGIPRASDYVNAVIQRADELTELFALALTKSDQIKSKIPMMIKKGIAKAFNKFDAYQLAKYKATDKQVKLRDALFITHPKPKNEEQQKLFDMLANDTLPIPETWETQISIHGSTKENWEAIIPKMGYMAKIRNLRNFLKVGIGAEAQTQVIDYLTNPIAVSKSRLLPFRFLTAYRQFFYISTNDYKYIDPKTEEIIHVNRTMLDDYMDAIIKALDLSVGNLPSINGKTAILIDTSGSMEQPLSQRPFRRTNNHELRVQEQNSQTQAIDVATLLGAIGKYVFPEADTYVFGENFKKIRTTINRQNPSILDESHKFLNFNRGKFGSSWDSWVGHSTNAYKVLRHFVEDQVFYDRILILSDEQLYNEGSTYRNRYFSSSNVVHYVEDYRKTVNPHMKLYSFNVVGYGHISVPESDPNTRVLAGWSDKVFKLFEALEQDPKAVINLIEGIKVP